jgi:hypothetical protein
MTKSVTIRAVPDDVVSALASRAALSGRSLQEYLLGQLIELSVRPDINHWVADVRGRKSASPVSIEVGDLLAARDADRR